MQGKDGAPLTIFSEETSNTVTAMIKTDGCLTVNNLSNTWKFQ